MQDRTGQTSEDRYGMSSEDATTLFELRRIYEHTHKITLADGVWRASWMGNSLITFTADSGQELRSLLGQDYAAWAQEARRHNT